MIIAFADFGCSTRIELLAVIFGCSFLKLFFSQSEDLQLNQSEVDTLTSFRTKSLLFPLKVCKMS